jgi:hypothetical protein
MRAREVLIAVQTLGTLVAVGSAGGCGSDSALESSSGNHDASVWDAGVVSIDSALESSSGRNDAAVVDDAEGPGGGSDASRSGMDVMTSPGTDASTTGCTPGTLGCLVPAGCTTSVSGTVYDPAGVNPLYNAFVYIPQDPKGTLPPIKSGTNTCNTCDVSIGDYVAATASGPDGRFTLTNVPATTHVPLVVQIGKWRREVFLDQVNACTNNGLSGSLYTRLPAKKSEGDIPQMALVTGAADNLGCLMVAIGLDPSEYTAPHGGGRLDIYKGLGGGGGAPGLSNGMTAGDCTTDHPACVWNSKTNLEAYDILLLGCEGDTFDPAESSQAATNKTPSSKQALHDWLDEGGKVFATHFHYTWFKNSPAPDFQGTANWLGNSPSSDQGTYTVDTTFPKGMAFSQWLSNVGATSNGALTLTSVAESVAAVNGATQRWIFSPNADPQSGKTNDTKYMSILTPVGGIPVLADAGPSKEYCGKAVFSDFHAGGQPTGNIPASCAANQLNGQLKALEFLFFDLSACVANDGLAPPPPPQPSK